MVDTPPIATPDIEVVPGPIRDFIVNVQQDSGIIDTTLASYEDVVQAVASRAADLAGPGVKVKKTTLPDLNAVAPNYVEGDYGEVLNDGTNNGTWVRAAIGAPQPWVFVGPPSPVAAVTSALAAEVTNRGAAVTAEATARVAADATNAVAISTEARERKTADGGAIYPLMGGEGQAYRSITVDSRGATMAFVDWDFVEYRRDEIGRLVTRDQTQAETVGLRYPLFGDWRELSVDSLGVPLEGVKLDGTVWSRSSGSFAPVGSGATKEPSLTPALFVTNGFEYTYTEGSWRIWGADVDVGFGLWGQSYVPNAALGDYTDAPTNSIRRDAYSTTARNPGVVMMPADGLLGGGAHEAYSDLKYPTRAQSPDFGEPGAAEAGNRFTQRCLDTFGVTRRLIFHGAAQGGQGVPTISRGSPVYNRLINQAKCNVRISAAEARRYVQAAIAMFHGETDWLQPRQALLKAYTQVSRNLEDDICAITGQSERIRFFWHLPNRKSLTKAGCPGSTWAILKLNELDPDHHVIVGDNYAWRHGINAHLDILGGRQQGLQWGDKLFDGLCGNFTESMRVLDQYRTGARSARLEIKVPRGGTLIKDTSGAIVGYPSDKSASNYIGPWVEGDPTPAYLARDGGIWAFDVSATNSGRLGVVSAVVGPAGRIDNRATIDLTFDRDTVGLIDVYPAAMSQDVVTGGDRNTAGRTVFRGSVAMPNVVDMAEPQYDWLWTQCIRIP